MFKLRQVRGAARRGSRRLSKNSNLDNDEIDEKWSPLDIGLIAMFTSLFVVLSCEPSDLQRMVEEGPFLEVLSELLHKALDRDADLNISTSEFWIGFILPLLGAVALSCVLVEVSYLLAIYLCTLYYADDDELTVTADVDEGTSQQKAPPSPKSVDKSILEYMGKEFAHGEIDENIGVKNVYRVKSCEHSASVSQSPAMRRRSSIESAQQISKILIQTAAALEANSSDEDNDGLGGDMPAASPLLRKSTSSYTAMSSEDTRRLKELEEVADRKFEVLAEKINDWNWDIFEAFEVTPRPLVKVGFVCLDAFSHSIELNKEKMFSFLSDIEASYRDVPYHNRRHGACVGRSVFSFCKQEGGLASCLTDVSQFALVLAGLVHDVNHPGVTSSFLLRASMDHLSDFATLGETVKRKSSRKSKQEQTSELINARNMSLCSDGGEEALAIANKARGERRKLLSKNISLGYISPPVTTPRSPARSSMKSPNRHSQINGKLDFAASSPSGGKVVNERNHSGGLSSIDDVIDVDGDDSDDDGEFFGLDETIFSPFDRELAVRYNDQSPLEHMHLAITFSLLRREENNFLSQEMLASIRSLLVKAVLGTDMANHSEQMTRLDVLIENLRDQEQNKQPSIPWYWPSKPPPNMKTDVEKETWAIKLQEGFVVELFLHAADIGSPAMPFEQFKKWNKLCQEEFFVQGEMEVQEFGHLISPAAGFDRAQPPISEHNFTNFFLNFLSKPLFHKLNDLSKIGFIEKKHDIILGESLSNIEQGVDPQNNNEGDEDERSEGELKRNVICGVNLNIQLENLQYNSDQWARIGKELKEQAEQAAKTTPPPPSPPVEVPKRSESPGSSPPKPTSSKMVNRANGATSPSQGQHTRSAAHSLFKSVAE